MNIDEKNITSAYSLLLATTTLYHQASEAAIAARAELETNRAVGLAQGTISGSNPEKREADARMKLPELYAALEEAQVQEKATKLSLELARITVEQVKMLLRLREVIAQEVENDR